MGFQYALMVLCPDPLRALDNILMCKRGKCDALGSASIGSDTGSRASPSWSGKSAHGSARMRGPMTGSARLRAECPGHPRFFAAYVSNSAIPGSPFAIAR